MLPPGKRRPEEGLAPRSPRFLRVRLAEIESRLVALAGPLRARGFPIPDPAEPDAVLAALEKAAGL